MSQRVNMPTNPETLKLAREKAGYASIADVVANTSYLSKRKDGVKELQDWEAGSAMPSTTATKSLASTYGMPVAYFYLTPEALLSNLPDISGIEDFRVGDARIMTPQLNRYLREVVAQRDLLREVLDEDDIAKIDLSWIGKWDGEDAETIASAMCKRIWQSETPKPELAEWISRIEGQFDIAVIQPRPHHAHSIGEEISGLALADDKIPIIVLNDRETLNRRLFTLLHELAHLMVKAPGISRHTYESGQNLPQVSKIEHLCNSVAENALMPKEAFRHIWSQQARLSDKIKAVHKTTGASLSATTVRAHHLNLIEEDDMQKQLNTYATAFRQKQAKVAYAPPQKRKPIQRKPVFGRGQDSLAYDRVGPRMTLKSLLAFDEGRLSALDLYDIFGVKLNNLPKIASKVNYSLVRWHSPRPGWYAQRVGAKGNDNV